MKTGIEFIKELKETGRKIKKEEWIDRITKYLDSIPAIQSCLVIKTKNNVAYPCLRQINRSKLGTEIPWQYGTEAKRILQDSKITPNSIEDNQLLNLLGNMDGLIKIQQGLTDVCVSGKFLDKEVAELLQFEYVKKLL